MPLDGIDLSPAQLAGLRFLCERSHLHFTAYFWQQRFGRPMIVGAHHKLMGHAIDRVFSGEIKRLIITVPPGYTKSEMAGIAFIARGFALNPRARFIYTTFSDPLAREHSSYIRDTIELPEYQQLWSLRMRQDTDAKERWRTTVGGGLLAKAAGGPITGFRAGLMESGFTGAIVIDDSMKPDDARHDLKRENINQRYHTTIRSRIAHEDVPIIAIMQRLHDQDLCGYLLSGQGGEAWHHLNLPVVIDNGDRYPEDWKAGIPIAHGLPDGPLWSAKHTAKQIDVLRVNEEVFASQYMQRPTLGRAQFFKPEWLRSYESAPPLETLRVYGASDYAVTADGGDWTVHIVAGMDPAGDLWVLDLWRERTDSGEWVESFCDLVEKWRPLEWAEEMGQIKSGVGPFLTRRMIERSAFVFRRAFPTRGDKGVRAQSIRGRMALRGLYLPFNAPWYPVLRSELLRFPQSGVPDDQVDALGLIGQLLVTIEAGDAPRDQKQDTPRGIERATLNEILAITPLGED